MKTYTLTLTLTAEVEVTANSYEEAVEMLTENYTAIVATNCNDPGPDEEVGADLTLIDGRAV